MEKTLVYVITLAGILGFLTSLVWFCKMVIFAAKSDSVTREWLEMPCFGLFVLTAAILILVAIWMYQIADGKIKIIPSGSAETKVSALFNERGNHV